MLHQLCCMCVVKLKEMSSLFLLCFGCVFALVACVELSGPPYTDGVVNLATEGLCRRVAPFVNKMSAGNDRK